MLYLWAGFLALIIVLLALDLGVFHRKSHEIGLREAIGWSAFWISLGLSFVLPIYFIYESNLFGIASASHAGAVASKGSEAVVLYLTGYVLEKSLSIDNIFVMAIIFQHFAIKPIRQHRVLYWGILGAIIMRAIMVFGGAWLFSRFDWLFYPFGAYLVFTGVRMVVTKESEGGAEDSRVIRLVRWVLPVSTEDHGEHFTARVDGRFVFTTLFLVLVTIELMDVVFAVDSVPAVLAITTDPFIVLTSNIFAILGLRSLYFVLASMIQKFRYLQYSLSAILVLIGAKMILHTVLHIPTLLSLVLILAAMAAGIAASILTMKRETPTAN